MLTGSICILPFKTCTIYGRYLLWCLIEPISRGTTVIRTMGAFSRGSFQRRSPFLSSPRPKSNSDHEVGAGRHQQTGPPWVSWNRALLWVIFRVSHVTGWFKNLQAGLCDFHFDFWLITWGFGGWDHVVVPDRMFYIYTIYHLPKYIYPEI